jgi:hypothetical protein
MQTRRHRRHSGVDDGRVELLHEQRRGDDPWQEALDYPSLAYRSWPQTAIGSNLSNTTSLKGSLVVGLQIGGGMIPAEIARTQPGRKYLAVHEGQLAVKPSLHLLREHRRPLLLCLEQTRRPAMADHVHRNSPVGKPVMLMKTWYKSSNGELIVSSLDLNPQI